MYDVIEIPIRIPTISYIFSSFKNLIEKMVKYTNHVHWLLSFFFKMTHIQKKRLFFHQMRLGLELRLFSTIKIAIFLN